MGKDLIQGSPEWLAMRQTKIGASDAAAIMGLSLYKTPYQLWEEKLGLREVVINERMRRGSAMEEEARKEFEHLTGFTVFPDVRFHHDYPWMMASLDGISIDDRVLVEIKNVNRSDHQTALDGKVPSHYFPQCQHQLMVTGLPYMYYYSHDALNPATVIVTRDEAYIADMVEKEEEFYRCMMEFEAPELCERDYIEREDKEWAVFASQYIMAQESRKLAEEIEDHIRKELIKLADGKNSKGCGIRMTKYHRKGTVQYAKVPELQGVDLEPYRKPPSEAWRIGEINE